MSLPIFHFYRYKFWDKIISRMGWKKFPIAILAISLNFLYIKCQNSYCDPSFKIILIVSQLMAQLFSLSVLCKAKNWKGPDLQSDLLSSYESFSLFHFLGNIPKRFTCLIEWFFVFHTVATYLYQYPEKGWRNSKYCNFQYTLGNTVF
jgi:hypothetical protein